LKKKKVKTLIIKCSTRSSKLRKTLTKINKMLQTMQKWRRGITNLSILWFL